MLEAQHIINVSQHKPICRTFEVFVIYKHTTTVAETNWSIIKRKFSQHKFSELSLSIDHSFKLTPTLIQLSLILSLHSLLRLLSTFRVRLKPIQLDIHDHRKSRKNISAHLHHPILSQKRASLRCPKSRD